MIQNYFHNVKRILGSLISNARTREGWGTCFASEARREGNTFSCGAFCDLPAKALASAGAKNEIRRRAKIIKSQRPDFRGKKFGFHSGDTATLN